MSNTIRFDALLLRALAAELDARLRGLRAARAQFVREHRTLVLEAGPRRQPLTLAWRLQPGAAHVALAEGGSPASGALLQLAPGTFIASVRALPDERIVRIELAPGEDAPATLVRSIVIELIGTRWNALALDADEVIRAALLPRPDETRQLRAGVRYAAPAAGSRAGTAAAPTLGKWQAVLAVPPGERTRALLAGFAWTSSLNADWILGDALRPDAAPHVLAEAFDRYLWLTATAPEPALRPGGQPYPKPLGADDVRAASLLAAFALAAAGAGNAAAAGGEGLREMVLARLHDRMQRVRARHHKLREEARGAREEAARLRAAADLLLASLGSVPRGSTEVELTDFSGQRVRLRLDPARAPQQNARQWYEQAGRRERAAERTPALLERAAAELQRLEALRARVAAGQAEAGELQQWLQRAAAPARAAALPYRRYRTSGGLEVRVGRNARSNDALTREHSSPEDIWLHARDAGGAHVVLRWQRRGEKPPRADLEEAAVLAALHSRARTSRLVPVDWTRRKYVRKPRKAPPGLVVLERAETLFVAPDPGLEQRLRTEEGD